MSHSNKTVLLLTSWYPNNLNPSEGIFIRKQAIELSRCKKVKVLYFQLLKNKKITGINSTTSLNNNLSESIISLPYWGIYKILSIIKLNILTHKFIKNVNVINLCMPYHIGVLALPALIISNKKLFITEHWSGYSKLDGRYDNLNFIIKYFIKHLFNKATKIIVVSNFLLTEIDKRFKILHKTIVIPNVLNGNIKPEVKKHHNTFQFIAISNFDEKVKNTRGIVDAFELLIDKYNVKLILAGEGSGSNQIQDYINTKSEIVKKAISLPGYIPNNQLETWYSQSDCYVLNSHIETFSITTAEALLSGIPCVITKCGGPEEFINETNGIKVEPGNHIELSKAMEHMIINQYKYSRLSIWKDMQKRYGTNIGIEIAKTLDS